MECFSCEEGSCGAYIGIVQSERRLVSSLLLRLLIMEYRAILDLYTLLYVCALVMDPYTYVFT